MQMNSHLPSGVGWKILEGTNILRLHIYPSQQQKRSWTFGSRRVSMQRFLLLLLLQASWLPTQHPTKEFKQIKKQVQNNPWTLEKVYSVLIGIKCCWNYYAHIFECLLLADISGLFFHFFFWPFSDKTV